MEDELKRLRHLLGSLNSWRIFRKRSVLTDAELAIEEAELAEATAIVARLIASQQS